MPIIEKVWSFIIFIKAPGRKFPPKTTHQLVFSLPDIHFKTQGLLLVGSTVLP